MKSTKSFAICALAFMVVVGAPAYSQGPPTTGTQEQNIQAYVDLLRADVKSQKVAVISQMMQFTPAQASVFWPVYTEYDKELTQLGNEKLALIRDYGANYGAITDQKAEELVMKALDLEARRTALKKKYYKRFGVCTSLPATPYLVVG